jgi:hypothetical protein
MTKTDLPFITGGDLRPASDPSTIDDFKNYVADVWFDFCNNVFKKYLQDLHIV